MRTFHKEVDYRKYLEIVDKYHEKFSFRLYHFCLMPNHVHLLLKCEDDLSELMHGINLCYAQYYKKQYKHIGHFWQDRFRSYIVQEEKYLLAVARYIERNPLIAKLINSLSEYNYSSYNFYAYGKDCGVQMTYDPLYAGLAMEENKRRLIYIKFVDTDSNQLSAKINEIPLNLEIVKAQFIGSKVFAKELVKTNFRGRIKLKRGRPRKNQEELIPNLL